MYLFFFPFSLGLGIIVATLKLAILCSGSFNIPKSKGAIEKIIWLAIVNSFLKKKQYYYYTQRIGIKYTSVVVAIIVVYSCFQPEGMKNAQPLVIYMCLGLYSFYMLETMRSYFRIVNLNRTYSKLNVYNSVILLLLNCI